METILALSNKGRNERVPFSNNFQECYSAKMGLKGKVLVLVVVHVV
jgi:hypothetical protein